MTSFIIMVLHRKLLHHSVHCARHSYGPRSSILVVGELMRRTDLGTGGSSLGVLGSSDGRVDFLSSGKRCAVSALRLAL